MALASMVMAIVMRGPTTRGTCVYDASKTFSSVFYSANEPLHRSLADSRICMSLLVPPTVPWRTADF
jgi:hypothetical protein